MTAINLINDNDEHIATAKLPPMKEQPSVIKWGERLFVKTDDPTIFKEGKLYEAFNVDKTEE